MLRLNRSKQNLVAAFASVLFAVTIVAIADDHMPTPPPDTGVPVPACYTTYCKNEGSKTACIACCDNDCPTNDKDNCITACEGKWGNISE